MGEEKKNEDCEIEGRKCFYPITFLEAPPKHNPLVHPHRNETEIGEIQNMFLSFTTLTDGHTVSAHSRFYILI